MAALECLCLTRVWCMPSNNSAAASCFTAACKMSHVGSGNQLVWFSQESNWWR